MKAKDHSFFANIDCKYYPCHAGADAESFNCLFCYCPLYFRGKDCGGNYTYTEAGIKDCSKCLLPHAENGFEYIMAALANGNIHREENK